MSEFDPEIIQFVRRHMPTLVGPFAGHTTAFLRYLGELDNAPAGWHQLSSLQQLLVVQKLWRVGGKAADPMPIIAICPGCGDTGNGGNYMMRVGPVTYFCGSCLGEYQAKPDGSFRAVKA